MIAPDFIAGTTLLGDGAEHDVGHGEDDDVGVVDGVMLSG